MELLLRSACTLAFVSLSIQLCPLWPRFGARPFQKQGSALRLRALLLPAMVQLEDSSLLPHWKCLSHTAQAVSSGHCTSQASFNISSSVSDPQLSDYREEKQLFPWNLCFCIHPRQMLSAMHLIILPTPAPKKPGLRAPAIPISLSNLSIASFLTSSHFFQRNTKKKEPFSVNIKTQKHLKIQKMALRVLARLWETHQTPLNLWLTLFSPQVYSQNEQPLYCISCQYLPTVKHCAI